MSSVLGDGRFVLSCFDGATRLGVIRGKLRRRAWVRRGDVVLVARRGFQDAKADIIDKYSADEVRRLVKTDELPASCQAGDDAEGGGWDSEGEIDFDAEDD